MTVMHEAIEDGMSERRLVDIGMPLIDRRCYVVGATEQSDPGRPGRGPAIRSGSAEETAERTEEINACPPTAFAFSPAIDGMTCGRAPARSAQTSTWGDATSRNSILAENKLSRPLACVTAT